MKSKRPESKVGKQSERAATPLSRWLSAIRWPRATAVACAAFLALLALWGWETVVPLLFVPLIVGLSVGLCTETRAEAVTTGLLAGVLGTLAAVGVYEPQRLFDTVNAIPRWVDQDLSQQTYWAVVFPLWGHTAPISAWLANASHLPMIAAGTLLMPAFALAAREAGTNERTRFLSQWLPWLVTLVAATCMVVTIAQTNPSWFTSVAVSPTPGTYRMDTSDNLRTAYIMKTEGKSYYAATVESWAQDARQAAGASVAGGKILSGSAAQIREPGMFYLWQLLTLGSLGIALGWASVLLAAALLPALYWGLSRAIGPRALFVAFMLIPGLILWSSNPGALEPEWWAVIFLIASFAVLGRNRVWLALVLALGAVLIRETTGTWLLGMCAAFVFLGLKDRRWMRPSIVAAGVLAAAAVAFLIHVAAGTPFFAHPSNGSSLLSYMVARSSRSFTDRTLAPFAYLMLPYGFETFSPVWLLPFSLVGLWVGLARTQLVRLTATLYLGAMSAYYFIFGATCSYWGQIVNPFLVIGFALFVVSLDRLGSPESWRLIRPRPLPADKAGEQQSRLHRWITLPADV